MKKLLLALVMLVSSTAFAQSCPTDDFEGHWQNPQWVKFDLRYRDCDHVHFAEWPGGPSFEIDLTGQHSTPLDVGGMHFELTVKPVDRRQFKGTFVWKIAQRPGSSSAPGFGVVVALTMPGTFGRKVEVITPSIVEFKYEKGNQGNMFDEGMELAVGVLNTFHVADLLSPAFTKSNFLVLYDDQAQ